jgi:hypothetical protein
MSTQLRKTRDAAEFHGFSATAAIGCIHRLEQSAPTETLAEAFGDYLKLDEIAGEYNLSAPTFWPTPIAQTSLAALARFRELANDLATQEGFGDLLKLRNRSLDNSDFRAEYVEALRNTPRPAIGAETIALATSLLAPLRILAALDTSEHTGTTPAVVAKLARAAKRASFDRGEFKYKGRYE